MKTNPTGEGTPQPLLLSSLTTYAGRWVPVTEALPPAGTAVLVAVRGDNCPAFAWLKFAAGDRTCPYFVCPQLAAMDARGLTGDRRKDITHWFAPTEQSLPWMPGVNDGARAHSNADWGLGSSGWEPKSAPRPPVNTTTPPLRPAPTTVPSGGDPVDSVRPLSTGTGERVPGAAEFWSESPKPGQCPHGVNALRCQLPRGHAGLHLAYDGTQGSLWVVVDDPEPPPVPQEDSSYAALVEASHVVDAALLRAISALNHLPPDQGPIRRLAGEAIQECRDAREALRAALAKVKP